MGLRYRIEFRNIAQNAENNNMRNIGTAFELVGNMLAFRSTFT
jgi:hypothetical protein